ncbi:MAG: YgiQ family radical SAM protein [Oscillospiraceae bacterium]|nr:YgiQ family radical SAM protein [Oscillospiraceae bacterium]
MSGFLPVSRGELFNPTVSPDFICVTGDAYVDHPSFGIAIVSRILESCGFTVGIISQPVNDSDFTEFGKPRHGFMVSGGNIDSMVANYTVAGKKRNDDDYSPGGKGGKRPDYAVNAYCKTIRRLFPDAGIVIGGLEASLRRFAHYDFWSNKVLPSVLISSGADLLIYGMAELTLFQLADRIKSGESVSSVTDLRGTCYLTRPADTPMKSIQCDSFELVSPDNEGAKTRYAKSCAIQYNEQDEVCGRTVVQRHGDVMLVQNPPQRSLSESELDRIYNLPFIRKYHPIYEKCGGVPAIREVEFSITWNRGCFGACNFCSITLHQGRRIQTRSEASIVKEAESFVENPNFKGYIHDVGGPTANFGRPSCKIQLDKGMCKRNCLTPFPCKNLRVSHYKYLKILRRLRQIKGVKKVFIRSGIRYDYIKADKNREFFSELVTHHVSGQLKVAPEHCSRRVLDYMRKPHIETYEWFCKEFSEETKRAGKEQYLVPYLMSSHPGATLNDAIDLAVWLKKRGIRPEQVQDFYPTPGTVSTAMYYTGLEPFTLESVYVARTTQERATQRALLQYYKPENRALFEKLVNNRGGNNAKKKSNKKPINKPNKKKRRKK